MVAKGWSMGEIRCWSKGKNFQLEDGLNSVNLKYSMVTTVNNTVLYTWKWLRERILSVLLTEKNAQCESCGLSFIWCKMRTITWEAAFQIALRNCSGEVGGRSVRMRFWWRGGPWSQAHSFLQKVAAILMKFIASHEEQIPPWMTLVLF